MKRGIVWAAIVAVAIGGVAGCGGSDEPSRDDSGAVTKATDEADVFSIRVGDCLPSGELEGEIATTGVVPCTEPHEGEVYATLTATGGAEFPGRDAMDKQTDGCIGEFETFIGLSIDESKLDISTLAPVAESWAAGDREILCIVTDPDGTVTGSLKGAKR